MSHQIAALKALPDAQLIAEHDEISPNTTVGVDYYLAEYRSREINRMLKSTDTLARRAFWLAVANTAIAVTAVVVAVIAIIATRR